MDTLGECNPESLTKGYGLAQFNNLGIFYITLIPKE